MSLRVAAFYAVLSLEAVPCNVICSLRQVMMMMIFLASLGRQAGTFSTLRNPSPEPRVNTEHGSSDLDEAFPRAEESCDAPCLLCGLAIRGRSSASAWGRNILLHGIAPERTAQKAASEAHQSCFFGIAKLPFGSVMIGIRYSMKSKKWRAWIHV